jgi:hypothetical protein
MRSMRGGLNTVMMTQIRLTDSDSDSQTQTQSQTEFVLDSESDSGWSDFPAHFPSICGFPTISRPSVE